MRLTVVGTQRAIEAAGGCIRWWFRSATRPVNPLPRYILQRLISAVVIGHDLRHTQSTVTTFSKYAHALHGQIFYLELGRLRIHVEKRIIRYSIPVLVDVHIPRYTCSRKRSELETSRKTSSRYEHQSKRNVVRRTLRNF